MKTLQTRFANNGRATVSTLIVEGVPFFVLEDEPRSIKVPGETRIPAGTYKIGLRASPSMDAKYLEWFPDMHLGMLWLQDVPGFEWIYDHVGNLESHTAGCRLIGQGCRVPEREPWSLLESKAGYERYYRMVVDAAVSGELRTEIVDAD